MRRATVLAHLILLAQLACRGRHGGTASSVVRREQPFDAALHDTPQRVLLAGRGIVVERSRAASAPFHDIQWDPSITQVEELEAVLDSDLPRKLRARSVDLARRIREYKREYFGVSQNGRQIIVADMFCELPSDWPEKVYGIPPDGGPCYVTVGYDPPTKTVLFVVVGQTQ
jgi:hypothetical protein